MATYFVHILVRGPQRNRTNMEISRYIERDVV
jgi:hypothetical protein